MRRHEHKFELSVAAADSLRREIASRLPVFEYETGCPYTLVSTVYFDTESRDLYARAASSYDNNEKVRLKEYYYEAADGEFRVAPHYFLELKCRESGRVIKKRIALPKASLARFLDGDPGVWPEAFEVSRLFGVADEGTVRASFDELQAYFTRQRLVAASVITYRRLVFQVDEEALRITFDDRIAVHRPRPEWRLETRAAGGAESRNGEPGSSPFSVLAGALTPGALGSPIRAYENVIVEIKCTADEYPAWLREALGKNAVQQVSKFTTSVGALFRAGPEGRGCGPGSSEEQRDPSGGALRGGALTGASLAGESLPRAERTDAPSRPHGKTRNESPAGEAPRQNEEERRG